VGDLELPSGFAPTVISRVDDRVWVTGTAGGAPAVVLLRGTDGIRSTIVLEQGRDASFAWIRPNAVLAVSGGELLQIDLKR
jgi:hypothetical protein